MLLCAKAMFLTSSQMERLCRLESVLMASLAFIKLSDTSELSRLPTCEENPGWCSGRQALSLLRTLPRRL